MTSPTHLTVPDPDPADLVAAMVALVRAAPAAQASVLVEFLAAFVEADAALDLAALNALPEGMKPTVLRFFEHCLHFGLTADELGSIASVVHASQAGSREVH